MEIGTLGASARLQVAADIERTRFIWLNSEEKAVFNDLVSDGNQRERKKDSSSIPIIFGDLASFFAALDKA